MSDLFEHSCDITNVQEDASRICAALESGTTDHVSMRCCNKTEAYAIAAHLPPAVKKKVTFIYTTTGEK